MNLLPEEAYYWNYSRHLSIGYLDHPPMVAWLIYIFDFILGKSEFAVRLPAFLGWVVFAYFMYRFSENTIGKGTGKVVLLLLAVLPIYLSVGFLMTPDAPYYVCWAGVLFFLERAIFGKQSYYWYIAGIFLGLGLLSKYSMGLILPAAFVFLLIDKKSRYWLKKPQPYLAFLIGIVIFFPTIYWNATHDWASFAFQGTRRWSGGTDFYLHVLIGSVLILITPLGLYEAVRVFYRLWKERLTIYRANILRYRKYLFLATFTLVPLSVFVIHSLQGQPKLNWTGPVWLAILPLIAARIAGIDILGSTHRIHKIAKRWYVTASILLVIFGGGFGYLVAGTPGLRKGNGLKLPIAWKAYGDRVEEIEERIKTETNSEPLIVGLDKYWLSSEANYYDAEDEESLPEFAGENLFGRNGLMWSYWVSPASVAGRNSILVSFNPGDLEQDWLTRYFVKLDKPVKEVLYDSDSEIGQFYWRLGYDYLPDRITPSAP